ncbi:MAG: hypothetical protein FWE12_01950 [Oscillospiraceae bacterium]|nr:hypothetical protein [Oscillospiraceae bacterium]
MTKALFQRTSFPWVKYSEYEWRERDGILYVVTAPNANPTIYNPLKDTDQLVLDALNVGMLQMDRADDATVKAALMDFVSKYGLLGFMTALPTTPHFTDYDAVYLPTNHFIRAESMPVVEYVEQFFPFEKPDFTHHKGDSTWHLRDDDNEMAALAMTFATGPMALSLSFQREYAERVDWLLEQFKDLAFTFIASHFYYRDYDKIDEDNRNLYRRAVAAFGGITPTYRIGLFEKPTIIWDFYSLSLGIQMMFSFMLTDEKAPLHFCLNCHCIFMAKRTDAKFCCPECKNQYNVGKSRGKK